METRVCLEIVKAISKDLNEVMEIKDPEKMVQSTTNIVTRTKLLLDGVTDALEDEGKTALAKLVLATKAIAQDPSAADTLALQELASSKKEVELVVKRLISFHASRGPMQERSISAPAQIRPESSQNSPPSSPVTEREERLLADLLHVRRQLMNKKEVKRTNAVPNDPSVILGQAALVINRSARGIESELSETVPRREPMLGPLVNMTTTVIELLELEDALFVAKFPMRKQVYTFTNTLIEKVIAIKQDRSFEIVRDIRSNLKGLLQSAEVMVEQCHLRSENIDDSKLKSIRRVTELSEKRPVLPQMQNRKDSQAVQKIYLESATLRKRISGINDDVEIVCLVCTSTAVDQSTQQPIARGSELVLQCNANISVAEIKGDLSLRTGISAADVELCIGKEPLDNRDKLINHGGAPFFMFNKSEPKEEDTLRPKENRTIIKDEDIDWSKYHNPLARALYDYIPSGEGGSGNLAFLEGDIVEIIVKSPDGWWEGKIKDRIGVFPASFVREICKSSIPPFSRSVSDRGVTGSTPLPRKVIPGLQHQQPATRAEPVRSAPSSPSNLSRNSQNSMHSKEAALPHKSKDRPLSIASAVSKKSFSPRFAKKVSCLAANANSDSDSDEDRPLPQRKAALKGVKKSKDKDKDKKGSKLIKSNLEKSHKEAYPPPAKQDSPQRVQISSSDQNKLSKGRYPRSPHSSMDDLSTNIVKRSSYEVAHICIDFLYTEEHCATDRIFRHPGNMAVVKKYLETIDNGQIPSTHNLTTVHTACTTLKALFRNDRINYLVPEFMVQEFHTLAVKTAPVINVKSKIQTLQDDPKKLLERLLKLFAMVLEQSSKNRTDLAAIAKTFGPLIFENCHTSRAEVILGYLISTCEFIF